MKYKYKKLRLRIVEKYDTIGNFADVLGLSINSVSRKLNCKSSFSQKDMVEWGELLDIRASDYGIYFFT